MNFTSFFRFSSFLLTFSLSITAVQAETTSITELPAVASNSLARYAGLDLEALFKAVAEDVHYEPYAGILRGADGTALARAGNDVDQALLLASLLKNKGYRVRFVSGELTEANRKALLMGLYPPELPAIQWPVEVQTYWPEKDPLLTSATSQHFWLELAQGDDSWLPLDPSFPRARIGEAYAEAKEYFNTLPASLHHRIQLKFKQQTMDEKTQDLGSVERNISDLALTPLGLTVTAVAQVRQAKAEQSAPVSGLFGGGLAGEAAPEPKQEQASEQPATPVATNYVRQLRIGNETLNWPSTLVLHDNAGSALKREWLEITLTSPDGSTHSIARDLFAHHAPGVNNGKPPAYRHHEIAILPGLLALADIRDYLTQVGKSLDLAGLNKRVSNTDAAAEGAFAQLSDLDNQLAPLTGRLATLAFAAESDSLTSKLAHANGVAVAYNKPRVIIFSVEGQEGSPMVFQANLDLRLDEVDAFPYPGHSIRAIELFHQARGMQNSVAEGNFIERIMGQGRSASTMNLMEKVPGGADGLVTFGPGQQSELAKLPQLSGYAKELMQQSLAAGRHIVVPAKPVLLAGRQRYGWWDLDPKSGRTIGVMDDGLHQAMTDYSLNVEHLGLNDETGRAIGVIVGATSTQILLVSGILEHGTITKELLVDVEKTINDIKCLSCPEFSIKVGAKAQVGDSCFYTSKAAGVANSGIGFCQKYADGFGCAASLILHGLRDEMGIKQKDLVNITPSAEAKAVCLSQKVE